SPPRRGAATCRPAERLPTRRDDRVRRRSSHRRAAVRHDCEGSDMTATTISPEANLPRLREGPAPEAGGRPAARASTLSHIIRCAPFVLLHLAPLAAFWTGLSWPALLLCLACYLINMVGVTVGYH